MSISKSITEWYLSMSNLVCLNIPNPNIVAACREKSITKEDSEKKNVQSKISMYLKIAI